MDLLLKDVHLVSPTDGIDEVTDIHISNGIIKKIGKNINAGNAGIKNLKGKTCVPGLYDMHVHFREPGQTHKEDLNTGSEAAANGGFTGVLIMPNTTPPLDSPLMIKNILERSKDLLTDIDIAACATLRREGESLAPILSLREAGAVAFTDDGSPVANPELMRRVLEYTAQTGTVMIQHCEDMKLSDKGAMNEGLTAITMGIRGIPAVSETVIISRDILLTESVRNSRYHIQHMSCGRSVDLLRDAKKNNINVTGEVCPHHFILTDKECLEYNTNAKMNPPLRTEADIEKILRGLADDTIDVICTDHAPHTGYEKSQGFYDAPFGIIGLETAVGLSYTYLVKKKVIPFRKLIEKMSVNPRRILGLPDIKFKAGEPANMTILDTNAKWKVDKNKFRSKSRNTPFDGFELQCKPYCVINKDKIIYSKL